MRLGETLCTAKGSGSCMPESSWRGFQRSMLLGRAREALEEQGVTDDGVDLLDEMDTWTAQDLYHWLLENDPTFMEEARAKVLAK